MSSICRRRRRHRHLTWLAMSNDMVTCVANIVDVEDDTSNLQVVFMKVISVHLYC